MGRRRKKWGWVAVPVLGACLVAGVAPADARQLSDVDEVAGGLEGPFGLSVSDHRILVAESGANRITMINPRTGETSVETSDVPGPTGVTQVGRNTVVIVTGEAGGPPDAPQPDPLPEGGSTVYVGRVGKHKRVLADLQAYELAHNTDGQAQFGPDGKPLDSLSNPFAVIGDRSHGGFVIVADAGANAVLRVSRNGDVTPLFVPPVITTGACAGQPNNDPAHTGCDPVPTGLAYGPDGYLYISGLSSLVPGEGRVYVVNVHTGALVRTITGLNPATGVTVGRDGSVYVSELLFGGPEGEGPPPPGFDPSQVGRIVRVARDGTKSAAQVTMPIGLGFKGGKLYSTSWAIAGEMGMPGRGQVVQVKPTAFEPIQ